MSEPNDKGPKLSRQEWLNGLPENLSEAERHDLEERLAGEAFEQRALRGRSFLKDDADANGLLAELDQAIDNRFESVQTLPPPRVVPLRKWWAAAAGVLVLLTAAWWLWMRSPDPEKLYATHFEHLENDLTITPMGSDSSVLKELAIALRPYDAHQYPEAVVSLAEYLAEHPDSEGIRLYYGISLLQSGRLEEAEAELKTVRERAKTADYRAAATWYLALGLLRARQPEEAKPLLKELAEGNSTFQKEAANVLKQW